MNQTTLFKYNFRVLMLNNWLLLAFPITVSQLTVFWLTLTRKFTPDVPAMYVEMVTPILAAFLGAHLLSAEYKTRVGAILATRPVSINKMVIMRLAAMLALVWALALISLYAFYLMMHPFDMVAPFLACVPSTLFLTMLALTYATLFRNSLAGFAVAGAYWALDLIPGAPVQPYLSIRTLSSFYAVQVNPLESTFLTDWMVAKILLLVFAAGLYIYHNRLVLRIGSPYTSRIRGRAIGVASAVVVMYVLSGAVLKVSYGYSHRGALPQGDLAWFRYQMASFGPLPVTSLFGPVFRSYVGKIDNPWRLAGSDEQDMLGITNEHKMAMHRALDSHPDSIWAATDLDGLAAMEARGEGVTPDSTVAYYKSEIAKFPNSPYVESAMREVARTYDDANKPDQAKTAYQQLLEYAPKGRFRSEAYRYLFENEVKAKNMAQALHWAEQWSTVAPITERFEALMHVTELRQSTGDLDGAKRSARDMAAAVTEFNRAVDDNTVTLTPKQVIATKQLAARAGQLARSLQ